MKKSSQSKLPLHEWVIILLFCLILATLAAFAMGKSKAKAPRLEMLPVTEEISFLQVRIEGAVQYPGLHQVPLRSTVKELLAKGKPLDSADLSQLNYRRQLRDGQVIHIPERRPITIQIKGAVKEPGSLQILSGTRYCELMNEIKTTPEANTKGLCKRRSFIQEGTSIDVPFKKEKKKKYPSK